MAGAAPSLPGNFRTVVVDEAAVVGRRQPFDDPAHAADALGRADRRRRAAHVGRHPTRVEGDGGDAAHGEIDRQALDHGVERRLGRAVDVGAAFAVVADAAHAARDENHLLARARHDVVGEGLGHAHRRQRVGPQRRFPHRIVGGAERAAVADHAGIVEQHVDRLTGERRGERADLVAVANIEPVQRHRAAGRGLVQRPGGVRRSAGGVDAPAVVGVLLGELQPETSIGAGDQNCLTDGSLL